MIEFDSEKYFQPDCPLSADLKDFLKDPETLLGAVLRKQGHFLSLVHRALQHCTSRIISCLSQFVSAYYREY